MTPKDKAEQLVDEFRNSIMSFLSDSMKDKNAKQCALKCVDEIIKANPYGEATKYIPAYSTIKYWQEVREEILKL